MGLVEGLWEGGSGSQATERRGKLGVFQGGSRWDRLEKEGGTNPHRRRPRGSASEERSRKVIGSRLRGGEAGVLPFEVGKRKRGKGDESVYQECRGAPANASGTGSLSVTVGEPQKGEGAGK